MQGKSMAARFTTSLGAFAVLILACSNAAADDEAELWTRDYNTARHFAFSYFGSYENKYGRALRMQQMLKACHMDELAAQVDRDLPDVALYAGTRFAADQNSAKYDLSPSGMQMLVTLATQSLVEGFQLGLQEAFDTRLCHSVGQAYDGYLKSKTK
jgi:hypothetical protein